jgi:hypothetical protein
MLRTRRLRGTSTIQAFRTFSSGEIDAAFNKLVNVPAGRSMLPGIFFEKAAAEFIGIKRASRAGYEGREGALPRCDTTLADRARERRNVVKLARRALRFGSASRDQFSRIGAEWAQKFCAGDDGFVQGLDLAQQTALLL